MGPPVVSPSLYWSIFIWFLVFSFPLLFIVLWVGIRRFVFPLDKKFPIPYPVIERGIPGSELARMATYSFGIILQKYRYRDNQGVWKRIVDGRFAYQDRIFGRVVDLRAGATKFQVFFAYFNILYFFGMVLASFLLIFHNFILYPEYGQLR